MPTYRRNAGRSRRSPPCSWWCWPDATRLASRPKDDRTVNTLYGYCAFADPATYKDTGIPQYSQPPDADVSARYEQEGPVVSSRPVMCQLPRRANASTHRTVNGLSADFHVRICRRPDAGCTLEIAHHQAGPGRAAAGAPILQPPGAGRVAMAVVVCSRRSSVSFRAYWRS